MGTEQDNAGEVHSGPRQIILCCDGTNNTLTGGPRDTNVLKIIGQLVPGDKTQIMYYDPGVGSPDQLPPLGLINYINRKRERIAGLANGRGIYENIAEAYLFLVEKYEPGDQIYIFGFSRGAFTARCVAGMVHLFGLIRAESKPLILTLIRVYFSTPCTTGIVTATPFARHQAKKALEEKDVDEKAKKEKEDVTKERLKFEAAKPDGAREGVASEEEIAESLFEKVIKVKRRMSTREEVACQVKSEFTSPHGKNAAIHFIGVWDTVASVGFPYLSSRSIPSDGNTKVKPFRHIRHALSMDERRATFRPRLYWENDYEEDTYWDHTLGIWVPVEDAHLKTENLPKSADCPQAPVDDVLKYRSLKQMWFRGVHSDVGGGYDSEESGLGDSAYIWMLNEAIGCGLRTKPKKTRPEWQKKPLLMHDQSASTPWWGLAGLEVRNNKKHQKASEKERVAVNRENLAEYNRKIRFTNFFKGKLLWLVISLLVALIAAVLSLTFSYTALHGSAANTFPSGLFQGSRCFDYWQRNFFPLGCGTADPNKRIAESVGSYPYAAIWFDFIFIIAYGWILGLISGWAFREVTLYRRPDAPQSPLLKLGWAPCFLVFADIAENLLSLLTIWLLRNNVIMDIDFSILTMMHIPVGPYHQTFYLAKIIHFFLSVANIFKWIWLAGCVFLIGWGILCRLGRADLGRQNASTPASFR